MELLITQEMDAALKRKLAELIAITEGPDSTLPPIQLTYDKIGTAAGYAYGMRYQISLNIVFLIEDFDQMLNVILGHELAHIMADHYHGHNTEAHGAEWQHFMALYGLPPDVYHKIDTSSVERQITKYKYTCQCPGRVYMVSTRRHRNIQVENKQSCCRYCFGVIQFADHIAKNPYIPDHLLHETKMAKAEWIMRNYNAPFMEMIDMLIQGAGLSSSGAVTYYYRLKKQLSIS